VTVAVDEGGVVWLGQRCDKQTHATFYDKPTPPFVTFCDAPTAYANVIVEIFSWEEKLVAPLIAHLMGACLNSFLVFVSEARFFLASLNQYNLAGVSR